MKLIRKNSQNADPAGKSSDFAVRPLPWKLLVVDDEPDVRALTLLNLRDFHFAGRALQFIEAGSAAEALLQLALHPDISVALVDVVMETDDAGLRLVEAIRRDLKNLMMRIVIRTGQPGAAPERYVIDHFDIDDYKDKTELTAQKLYTTTRSALKAYRDLQTIDLNRRGLEAVLEATPQLYQFQRKTLETFFQGVLMQVIALCNLTHSGLISTFDGVLTTLDGDGMHIMAGAGDLDPAIAESKRLDEIVGLCSRAVSERELPDGLREETLIVPLTVRDQAIGFIYLEASDEITDTDRALIKVMANQCSAAMENFHLQANLQESYEQVVETLALVAEFKDSTTGDHIRRLADFTARLSLEMGLNDDQANEFARAARLHDVGKVGISDAILKKPGKLTSDEFDIIKLHTTIGGTLLSRIPALSMSREVALRHHERWDGLGYPDGLAGEAIPLVSRIVAVADVFDALVTRRPYKEPWTVEQAVAEIGNNSGIRYDPEVVRALLRLHQRGELSGVNETR